jgi:hypothetical protein
MGGAYRGAGCKGTGPHCGRAAWKVGLAALARRAGSGRAGDWAFGCLKSTRVPISRGGKRVACQRGSPPIGHPSGSRARATFQFGHVRGRWCRSGCGPRTGRRSVPPHRQDTAQQRITWAPFRCGTRSAWPILSLGYAEFICVDVRRVRSSDRKRQASGQR